MTKEEAREKWLEALRNPEAKKAYNKLAKSPNSKHRCCLGHACHALDYPVASIHDDVILPNSVAKLLDIRRRGKFINPIIVSGKPCCDLTDVNDLTRKKMSEIADIIEQQFKDDNLLGYKEYTG